MSQNISNLKIVGGVYSVLRDDAFHWWGISHLLGKLLDVHEWLLKKLRNKKLSCIVGVWPDQSELLSSVNVVNLLVGEVHFVNTFEPF